MSHPNTLRLYNTIVSLSNLIRHWLYCVLISINDLSRLQQNVWNLTDNIIKCIFGKYVVYFASNFMEFCS